MLGQKTLIARVLYNENRKKWMVGPSDETVQSRSFHNTKSNAKAKARRLAKKHDGVLEVYTKDGTLQERKEYFSKGGHGNINIPGL
jgi:hypothetical protein